MFSERQDEVVYYDTFESADDITEDDAAEREELRRLQVSARQLEARRGRITAKRSYLRNKKVRMHTCFHSLCPGLYILIEHTQSRECSLYFEIDFIELQRKCVHLRFSSIPEAYSLH